MRLIVVLDCIDANALADFWSSALGFRRGTFHPPYVRLVDPRERWPNLLLQQVPEPKSGKNRMHLDIQVADVQREVERLTALGASIVDPPHDDAGFLTAILADPQGNEFCVIKPPEGGYDRQRLVAETASLPAAGAGPARARMSCSATVSPTNMVITAIAPLSLTS